MDCQNNNDSTHESNVAKKRHSPAELKASKHDLVDQSRSGENITALPEPTFRQVPVNVTRRTDSPVVPMPPPRNTKASDTKPERRNSNRKQRRRANGGDGSGSDSERDELKRTTEANPVFANEKKSSREIDTERQERVSLCGRMSMRRRQKMQIQKSNATEWRLTDFRRKNYDRPPLNKNVISHEEKLQEYLYRNSPQYRESRKVNIVGDLNQGLQPIIRDAEIVVLKQCFRFDDLKSSGDSQHFRLLKVLGKVLRALAVFQPFVSRYKTYKSKHVRSELPNSDPCVVIDEITGSDFWADVLRRFRAAHRMPSHTETARPLRVTTIVVNAMVDGFWDRVIFAMCDAAIWRTMHEAIDISLLEVIGHSRHRGQLTSSYINWMVTGIEASMLEDAIKVWHTPKITADDLDHVGPADFLGFFPYLAGPNSISLVLLNSKGSIQRIKEVSEQELADFGWHREKPTAALWRCEPAGDGRDILKVDVNGVILGIFGLKRGGTGSTHWRGWVFVPAAVLEEDPEKASLLARHINESEAHVLGLTMITA